MRDDHVTIAGRIGCRDPHQLEIQGPVVVDDVQDVLAVDDGMVHLVLDTLLARPHHARLSAEVRGIQQPFLARDGGAEPDHEVAVAACEARAHPIALVGLVEELDVVRDGRAELVQPYGVGAPRVVDGAVDDEPTVGGERGSGEGPFDDVRQLLARHQVADADRVALVAGDIHPEEHEVAVVGHLEAAEREELVPLGFDIAVEQDLLTRHLDVGGELGRSPVVGES